MCSGACGKYWPLDDIDKCPWELLTIKKAVRCWECSRALAAVGQAGAGVEAVYQELEPTDRGALKPMREHPQFREAPGRSSGNLEWED